MAEKMADSEVISAPQSVATEITGADRKVAEGRQARMREIFAKQPKRKIRISKELWGHETFVGINGYRFQIMNGVRVEVPEQVAQLLEDMGRI